MANTQAQVFVPQAAAELKSIVSQVLTLQTTVQRLQQSWTQMNKAQMRGWTELDWTAYAFTAEELRAALNGLDDIYTMSLTTLQTALPKLQKVIT